VNLRIAHVFDAVRRERVQPSCRRQGRCKSPGVQQDLAFTIAANEMAESNRVVDGRPAMRVDRHRVADGNTSVQHAHSIVLEYQPVMFGRGDDGVELGGPGPRWLGHGLVR